ncbi:LLM class flavin-dependent oxidoreductase [Kribbella deserti]|uniref:LLM class flavin-dependent oxidoreductase n=1 Tax=Kribbella deserti TaxID=1926257 RepID=A0ABV6QY56_9ACTN
MTSSAGVGFCFDRTFPPALVTDVARRLDAGGADRLWIIEDCFYTGGISLAAAALAVTERLNIGLGILPVVARNPAITAMELTTLIGLAPGRVLPGLGHGVQEWMEQMGVRAKSPLGAFEEVIDAVRRLLAGETVTTDGKYVRLTDVRLDPPPAEVPPLLAGVRGPKSLALAGKIAGGVVLAEPSTPSTVRLALDQAGRPEDFVVAVFSSVCVQEDRATAYQIMAPWLGTMIETRNPSLVPVPFFDELTALYDAKGTGALTGIPAEWWSEIGPIGTLADAAAHLDALEAEGVHHIGLFPLADVDLAMSQIDHVIALANR